VFEHWPEIAQLEIGNLGAIDLAGTVRISKIKHAIQLTGGCCFRTFLKSSKKFLLKVESLAWSVSIIAP
jgi:hypothetical protein